MENVWYCCHRNWFYLNLCILCTELSALFISYMECSVGIRYLVNIKWHFYTVLANITTRCLFIIVSEWGRKRNMLACVTSQLSSSISTINDEIKTIKLIARHQWNNKTTEVYFSFVQTLKICKNSIKSETNMIAKMVCQIIGVIVAVVE